MRQTKLRLKKLLSLPTICQGQTDDLKVGTKDTRIWLSRMTIEDGMDYNNAVFVEKLQYPKKFEKSGIGTDQTRGKVWIVIRQYEAK